MEKERLLHIIEQLLSDDTNQTHINPAYLQYFEPEQLKSIVKNLEDRQGVLSDTDKEWLEQFKKYT